MHRDVNAADNMIARLSDLLRISLQTLGVQETTLKAELDFLSSTWKSNKRASGIVSPWCLMCIRTRSTRWSPTLSCSRSSKTLSGTASGRSQVPAASRSRRSGAEPSSRSRCETTASDCPRRASPTSTAVSASRIHVRAYSICTGPTIASSSVSVRAAACRCSSRIPLMEAEDDRTVPRFDESRRFQSGGSRVSKIRTMVIDDEPVARERIVGLLQQEQDIELIGECADGNQAINAIQQQSPDLVFLDVQMPACDGFNVIQQVGADRMPAVVFVTAYDEYALRAFEVHAIDYLLKPFGRDRFQQTLRHAREHLERRRAGDLGKRLLALVQDLKPEPQKLDRLVVKSGGRVFFLRTDQIDWIEAAGNYVRLHLSEDSHLFRETMNNMEARLDARRFVRIHRSRIVNSDRIKELQPWFNGEYVVVLQNGARLTLSRGYREKLQERLGKAF